MSEKFSCDIFLVNIGVTIGGDQYNYCIPVARRSESVKNCEDIEDWLFEDAISVVEDQLSWMGFDLHIDPQTIEYQGNTEA